MRALLCCFLLTHGLTQAEDWPRWLGSRHDGVSQEKGWNQDWAAKKPAKRWEAKVGAGSANVAISQGRLFTTGNDREESDIVRCLDAITGRELWAFRYPCPYKARMFDGGTAATPTVGGEFVYCSSHEGHLFCLRAKDGGEVWRKHLVNDLGGAVPRWGYAAAPLVLGDLLYVDPGGQGGTIAALDKKTGEARWKAGQDPTAYSAPVPFPEGGTEAVLSFHANGLTAFQAATGQELFRGPWKTEYDINVATPLVREREVFVSSGYGRGAALFRWSDGRLTTVWENKELFTQFQNAVRWGDHLYGVHGDNSTKAELRCLEWATGKLRWKQRLVGNRGTLTIADGKLLVLTERGDLLLVEATPEGYRERGKLPVLKGRCWTAPVLANGQIYCRSTFGQLVCYDLAGG